jgi:hypothetical protein
LGGKTTKNAIRDLTEAIAALQASFAADSKSAQKDLASLTVTAKDLRDEFEELERAKGDVADVTQSKLAAEEAELKVLQETLKVLKDKNGATEEEIRLAKEAIASKKAEIKVTKKLTKTQQDQEEAGAGLAVTMGNMLGVSNDLKKSFAGQAKAALTTKKGFASFSKEMSETFSIANVGTSLLTKGFETTVLYAGRLFTEMDEGLASFNAATGAAGKFDKEITAAATGMVEYGVSVGDVANAHATLMRSFPIRELGDQSEELSAQFALWQKSGIAVDTATKSYTMLRRSYNMTSEDATGLQKRIMALGDEIGVGAPKMIEDFAAAAPRLSIHGGNMEKVFKRVASASAQLGLEVDDVLNLAEGFQTFEGSAKAAGQLNSILGGGFIDNMELMNAAFEDPAQAAIMIKDAFSAAGESVASLGPAGVKAAAQAAGFSDVGKFTAFLNGELDAAELAADEGLDLQKKMEVAATSSMTTLNNIDNAIKSLFTPLMPIMEDIARYVKEAPAKLKAAILLGIPALGSLMLAAIATILGSTHAVKVGQTIAAQMNMKGPGGGGDAGSGSPFGGGAFKWGAKMTKGAKLATGIAAVGAAASVGKDLYDLSQGDSSAANTGALVGSVFGGAIGAFGGPMGMALGVSLGNSAGEMFGEYLDDRDKKADASMPEKKHAEQVRHEEMLDRLDAMQKRSQEVKVKLDVDEFAYKRGLKLSTAEILSGG